MVTHETYEEAMRHLKAERGISETTKAKLRTLKPWNWSDFYRTSVSITYQTCRFCKRGHPELAGLWKYGVRHWICEDCRHDATGLPRPEAK